jgi:HAD superfamily hydrolase (TIGR01509 family)
MTRPDLVIFDCDGVLVDSETVTSHVIAANLTRHGLPLTPERCFELFVGGTIRGMGDKARALGAALPEDWIDRIYAEIYAQLRRGVAVIAGIPALLDRLEAQGIAYCVASNGSQEKMEITLGQTGLAARFAGRRWSAQDLGVAKPDPGLFLHAATAMGATPPACVVIEDSANGAIAARRAGMRCLGYVPDTHPNRLSAEGAILIRHMDEVAAHLGIASAG